MIYIPHSLLSDKLTLLPAPANLIPEITRSLNTAGSLILLKYVELSSLHKQTIWSSGGTQQKALAQLSPGLNIFALFITNSISTI